MNKDQTKTIISVLQRQPTAVANIQGSESAPNLTGTVSFYQMLHGVLMVVDICGLPESEDICGQHIFAIHIHDGKECSGTSEDIFKNAGPHYNPNNCQHPEHAGDLPPLFSNKGCAWSALLNNRFKIKDIIGRTVIVHGGIDDFSSQPAGNAGKKIGCGVIKKI